MIDTPVQQLDGSLEKFLLKQRSVTGDAYETVESKVREAIGNYFKFRLSRPELLNRIGDNIVVFNFISADVAQRIFDGMLRNVARRLQEERNSSGGAPYSRQCTARSRRCSWTGVRLKVRSSLRGPACRYASTECLRQG